jgi:hypothetical protein
VDTGWWWYSRRAWRWWPSIACFVRLLACLRCSMVWSGRPHLALWCCALTCGQASGRVLVRFRAPSAPHPRISTVFHTHPRPQHASSSIAAPFGLAALSYSHHHQKLSFLLSDLRHGSVSTSSFNLLSHPPSSSSSPPQTLDTIITRGKEDPPTGQLTPCYVEVEFVLGKGLGDARLQLPFSSSRLSVTVSSPEKIHEGILIHPRTPPSSSILLPLQSSIKLFCPSFELILDQLVDARFHDPPDHSH